MNITQAIEQLHAFGEIHGFHTELILKAKSPEGRAIRCHIEDKTICIGLKENESYANQISIQNFDF
jgi:hypothetical protein